MKFGNLGIWGGVFLLFFVVLFGRTFGAACSMAAFFALPLDISLAILGEWVSFRALGRLDSACTSSLLRDDFLAVVRDPVFKISAHGCGNVIEDGFAQWLNDRGVRLAAIEHSCAWIAWNCGLKSTLAF